MYTVLVGLIPVVFRALLWIISQHRTMDVFSASDFVAFGLILHISSINEIEHFNDLEKSWKTFQIGAAVFFIAVYSVLFASHLFSQANLAEISVGTIRIISMILSVVSFLLSFSVYHRISRIENIP